MCNQKRLITINHLLEKLSMTIFLQISVHFRYLLALILCVLGGITLQAQPPDSVSQLSDSLSQVLQPVTDTVRPTNTKITKRDTLDLNLSEDALEEEVTYSAKDSMRLDAINEVVYLYGEAEVKYTSVSMKAGKITFDMANDLVIAETIKDSLGQDSQKPVFTEGQNKPISADKMRYNFITKKGMIYNATTTEAGGYIRSSVTKIVSKQDSIHNSTDVLYGQNAIYTSCDHPEPHFGVRSTKQKIIPEQVAIVGPSNIEIMGIPTPLWLPFGFFPLSEGQSTGLIFPKDYEYSPNWGYGLRNVGWYFGLGDHWDLQLLGDIYTRGSWGVSAVSRYKRRYVSSGNLKLGYSRRITGDPLGDGTTAKNAIELRWSHAQDAKFNPTINFRGNVNIQTNSFAKDNSNDAENVLNSVLTSNVSLTKNFPGRPFRLSASFGHSQNVNNHNIQINFPTVDFSMQKVFPFKNKKRIGKERWYEKIGVAYTSKIQNTITGKDTLLFQPDSLDFRYGATHSVPINANFKLLKYINVSPFIRASSKWYLETLDRQFDNTNVIDIDTVFDASGEPIDINRDTTFGAINDITNNGFRTLNEFTTGVSLNTQLFGTLNLRRGPIKAIRHIVKPSVSFNYTPDYTNDFFGYWKQVQYDTRYPDEYRDYNVFQGGLFGQASQGGSQSMSYSVTNIFEAKMLNRRDTANPIQKVKLLNNLGISGSYNFSADSLKLSVINVSGNTTILKKINASFGVTLDPLAANTSSNGRINTYEWTSNRRPFRWTSARLSMNTKLSSDFFSDIFGRKSKKETADKKGTNKRKKPSFLENLRVNYTLAASRKYFSGVDSSYITQNNIRISGGTVNITTKWKLTIGGVGYDFVEKTFTYPDFQFYRDLHCWEMGFSWQPQRGTYSFYLRVKSPSQLDFLNVPYRRNNYDPLGGF